VVPVPRRGLTHRRNVIKVTLDTDVLPADDLLEAARGLDCEFAAVSVTDREVEGTSFAAHVGPIGSVHETALFGEARFGSAVFGSQKSDETLGEILRIIGTGSFPQLRANLSEGQLHQLRDALILEAHIREQRDIFITGDARAFIRHGKREELRAAFGVRILTRVEFLNACTQNQLTAVYPAAARGGYTGF